MWMEYGTVLLCLLHFFHFMNSETSGKQHTTKLPAYNGMGLSPLNLTGRRKVAGLLCSLHNWGCNYCSFPLTLSEVNLLLSSSQTKVSVLNRILISVPKHNISRHGSVKQRTSTVMNEAYQLDKKSWTYLKFSFLSGHVSFANLMR